MPGRCLRRDRLRAESASYAYAGAFWALLRCRVQSLCPGLAITLSDVATETATLPVHSEHTFRAKSVSTTRSTKTTNRTGVNFEIVLLTWSPLTESNRRPPPYHGHGDPP